MKTIQPYPLGNSSLGKGTTDFYIGCCTRSYVPGPAPDPRDTEVTWPVSVLPSLLPSNSDSALQRYTQAAGCLTEFSGKSKKAFRRTWTGTGP